MSRLFVQNIPPYVTDKTLREHFASQGEVTDARVMKTHSGKSRKFGFIGYRTNEQADAALKYFDRSFFDTCKLSIQFAKSRGSAELERPWSRYSKVNQDDGNNTETQKEEFSVVTEKPSDTTTTTSAEPASDSEDEEDKIVDNKETSFEEFLEVVQPRSQTKFWNNDDAFNPNATKEVEHRSLKLDKTSKVASDDDDDSTSVSSASDEEENEKQQPVLSAMDYLKSKVSKTIESLSSSNADTSNDTTTSTTEAPIETDIDENDIKEEEKNSSSSTSTLFVRNLPFSAEEEDLSEFFECYGPIKEINLPLDDSKRRKGFGYVHFENSEDASTALNATNNQAFQGRLLHVMFSNKKEKSETDDASSHLTYKQKQEAARQRASELQTGWNASYIRSDTTVDALASRLGVSKGEILDVEEGNMAVKMAIGETILVKENKEYLAEQGVDLNILFNKNTSVKRSTTTILVKNLPFSTEVEELMQLFGKHGEIGRCVLPPSKSVALIEFLEPTDARKAFRSLSYKKFQHVPLYLEWAPLAVFTTPVPEKKNNDAGGVAKAMINDEENDSATLFVKNLSFATTDESLHKAFKGCSGIRKATVARKKDVKRPNGPTLSMGYGFIEFSSPRDAEKALGRMQGLRLDGYALDLKLSQKKDSSTKITKSAKGKKTKITVRNVAFEATAKEIRELFAAFGKLKSVRLPKKFDGSHRGFAFVEFLTEQEALNAFTALGSTHLYGRHLVLEWATEASTADDAADGSGTNMNTLRQKAARDLSSIDDAERRAKASKRQKQDEMDF